MRRDLLVTKKLSFHWSAKQ